MDREFLKRCLDEGLSLDQIAERVNRHPSTVSYHLKKHGLVPNGHDVHAPNRRVDPERLRELVDAGATVREAARALGVGYSTVRYWLKRLELKPQQLASEARPTNPSSPARALIANVPRTG